MKLTGITTSLIAAAIMAAISAFADAFWAAALEEHRAVYGVVHGALVLGGMGAVVTWAVGGGRLAVGALAGVLIGVVAAGAFYVLYPVAGPTAMIIAWVGMWLAFAALANALGRSTEPLSRSVARAVTAAAGSGLAFWAISDIWLGAWDPGPLYLWNFAAWLVAFLPGFAALLLSRDPSGGRS